MACAVTGEVDHIFETIRCFRKSLLLKTAIELDVFSVIAQGKNTLQDIAAYIHTPEKGLGALLNALVICGFLQKNEDKNTNTEASELFLSTSSTTYLGNTCLFYFNVESKYWETLTDAVKQGGAIANETTAPENPVWVTYASDLGHSPLFKQITQNLTSVLQLKPEQRVKVLDIAAGHGMIGIMFAQQNPRAEIVAVDWKPVLQVAKDNATKNGVIDRYSCIEGDAFQVDFGTDYDFVLLSNFVHHFDIATNITLLQKVHKSLKPGGKVAIVDTFLNDDQVSPAASVMFNLTLVVTTKHGATFTGKETELMLSKAAFYNITLRKLCDPNAIYFAQKQ